MTSSRIDRIARFMAVGASRRTVVKSISGGTLAGAAMLGGMSRVSAAIGQDAAIGERSVLLYESMAETVGAVFGHCDDVVQALESFREENAELMTELEAEEASWTSEQRIEHHSAYHERMSQATAILQNAVTRCGFHPDSTSPLCSADMDEPSAGVTTASARRAMEPAPSDSCQGCDIQCICVDQPPTSGQCWLSALACFGGSSGSCCWWGICTFWSTSYCEYQAQNCCNL
jgi:hypothetical protein